MDVDYDSRTTLINDFFLMDMIKLLIGMILVMIGGLILKLKRKWVMIKIM